MKFENFTTNLKAYLSACTRLSVLPALLVLLSTQASFAQPCPLGCNNNVQISLDGDCSVVVTPSMILEGQGPASCGYTVAVLGANDQPIPGSPTVTGDYIGKTLKVRVSLGNNSCWGLIHIEDKLPPVIDCPTDLTVSCYQDVSSTLPIATDNCGDATVSVLSDVTTDLDCNAAFSAQRVITYRAEDESGNRSALCTTTINYSRIGLGDIVFPDNKDDVEDPALDCDNTPRWDLNNNGYPDVAETGAPTTTDGYSIFPNNSLCELNATFSDQRLEICESSFKVLRKWTVLDWCTGMIEEEFQIIKVIDKSGPIVTCPVDNFQVSANPYECSGDWSVEPPNVVFDCSSTSYTVAYQLGDGGPIPPTFGLYITDNVVTMPNGTFVIRDLPLGRTWIRYTITDACGNSTNCFTEVDVVDNVPPIPVCDEFTVVTLSTQGTAMVNSRTFDDGSHDNCSDVTFSARRMTPGCGQSTTTFTEFVQFCCADVGREIMVELRVADSNNNTNTCMVNVNVQDKIAPVITCPANVTLDCGDDINDPALVGSPVFADNCGTPQLRSNDTGSLNQCNVGTIRRRYTVTDAGGREAFCDQSITVIDPSPFRRSDITFPPDVDLTGCMNSNTGIEDTGEPTFEDDECSLVAYTFNDQVFQFVDGACFKILRTFTVIDWCTFDQNNPQAGGIWQKTQIIKLNNTTAPTITGCVDITACVYGPGCAGEVELILNASDDCTPQEELDYSYALDINNNGTTDRTGTTANASRVLEVGTHKISWTVEDRCGNQKTCSQLIEVEDCKKPTPYCLSEITTVIMPTTGEIAIWASDYDLASTDNCPGDLRFSFSTNVNNTSRTFNCDNLGINTLQIWVTDAAGNQDFCETRINIQSNGDECMGSSPRIAGAIHTETSDMVSNVMVELKGNNTSETRYFETQENGKFAFNDATGNQYRLSAVRNDDHANGVSTLDLVLIQRHILGIAELDSPYKVVAADINKSESISGADIVQLRKVILGITSEFPENNSWRFVDANQTFVDAIQPWPIKEYINIDNNSATPNLNKDFVAIKIGDINGTRRVGKLTGEGDVEGRATTNFAIDNLSFTAGERIEVPVYATAADMIYGYQFTMDYDAATLDFVGIAAGTHKISADQMNVSNNGHITVSYDQAQGVEVSASQLLFYLTFESKSAGRLSDLLSFGNDVATSEVYGQDLSPRSLGLVVRESGLSPITLMQNTPNPFTDETSVSFSLNEDAQATLTVFDVNGRVVLKRSGQYNKGINTIAIDADQLNTQGVLYYQLESNGYKAAKRMILIRK